MLTTSSIFLKTLREAGITHAFVNWGSDHPALLEDLARQRNETGAAGPKIITCPNEMVALSAAHGYALVAGKPAAVIVHVDVGTQALAGAVHNADRGRVPILIYAGAAPYSTEGELKGGRNEFIFWLQDVPDQPSIVRQYMRFTSQINSGKNVDQVVMRALQFANSSPKGPVYLWGRREAMEEVVDDAAVQKSVAIHNWLPLQETTIPKVAAREIAEALITSKKPLVVTSYLGRDPLAVPPLVTLSELLAIPVFISCPTSVCFPQTHPNFVGCSFGKGDHPFITDADLVLVLDSDIPWIPAKYKPPSTAIIYHIDVDVLKANTGMFHIDAKGIWQASSRLSLESILSELSSLKDSFQSSLIETRSQALSAHHSGYIQTLHKLEQTLPPDGSFTVPNLFGVIRNTLPPTTLFLDESVTNFALSWSHLLSTRPGSHFTSGASSLGWGLGASVGAYLAMEVQKEAGLPVENDLLSLIVGDGSYLFGIPSTAYWIARRYNTPFLTVVLHNGGWKAPKLSMLGVYPNGIGSSSNGQELTTAFTPGAPDYSGIAIAAGGAWGRKVSLASELEPALKEAVRVVKEERRCAVLDCALESF